MALHTLIYLYDLTFKSYSSQNLHRKELSPYKLNLEKALNDASQERDKALQELARLKQHLLDKVFFKFLNLYTL